MFGVLAGAFGSVYQDRNAEFMAQVNAERAVEERKAALGYGDWVLRHEMHPMLNVDGRLYRDRDGNIGRYVPGWPGQGQIEAWFFPWDDRRIAEHKSPISEAVEVKGKWRSIVPVDSPIPKVRGGA